MSKLKVNEKEETKMEKGFVWDWIAANTVSN